MDNATQKYLLYKQFVGWRCDRCAVAPFTDCLRSLVYQEFIKEQEYFKNHNLEIVNEGIADVEAKAECFKSK